MIMEQIINRRIKWFYGLMIVLYGQLILKNIVTTDVIVDWMIMFASTNLFLYIAAVWYNLRRKYIQGKWILIVLSIVTILNWIFMTIHEIMIYDGFSSSIILNSISQHMLIEWILLLRISTINRLEDIAEKGGSKWGKVL